MRADPSLDAVVSALVARAQADTIDKDACLTIPAVRRRLADLDVPHAAFPRGGHDRLCRAGSSDEVERASMQASGKSAEQQGRNGDSQPVALAARCPAWSFRHSPTADHATYRERAEQAFPA